MLFDNSLLSQVKALEQKLQTESSEEINDALTNEDLKTAAEMFLYLITCPNTPWFRSWSSFYTDLFLTRSADKIILTLNRMMKTETSKDMDAKDAKVRAEKLLKMSTRLLSLKYEQIQSLQPKENSGNGSAIFFNDSFIQYGAMHNFQIFCKLYFFIFISNF